jgi:hypothetical protein
MNNTIKPLPYVQEGELLEVILKMVKSKDCYQSGGSAFVTLCRVATN